jgi:hypothetical protein
MGLVVVQVGIAIVRGLLLALVARAQLVTLTAVTRGETAALHLHFSDI